MAYATPRTWVAGDVLTAAQMNQDVRDNQLAAFPLAVDAWTTYVPTNTNVTVGNGTQTARYQRVGRTIFVRYSLTWGSTTSFGGNVSIGLPVAAASAGDQVGVVSILDFGTANYVGVGLITAGGVTVAAIHHSVPGSNAGAVNATAPMTWTTSDVLRFSVTYESLT